MNCRAGGWNGYYLGDWGGYGKGDCAGGGGGGACFCRAVNCFANEPNSKENSGYEIFRKINI